MRFFVMVCALLLAWPALAAESEFEMTLYLQPDDTGQNTQNKSVKLRGDQIRIEESQENVPNRVVKRTATAEEMELLRTLISERIKAIELTAAERLDMPRVEIQFEFDGNTRAIEIEEYYPIGGVPEVYIAVQELFFDDPFK